MNGGSIPPRTMMRSVETTFFCVVSRSSDDRGSGRSKAKRDSSAGSDDEEGEGDDDKYRKNVRQHVEVAREARVSRGVREMRDR